MSPSILQILAQAGIVSRQSQGVSAYYSIANPFLFELCNLVCSSLAIRMEQQSQPLKEFAERAAQILIECRPADSFSGDGGSARYLVTF